MKKFLPITAAVLCGLVMLVDYFVPDPRIDAVGAILAEGAIILVAMALILGILNLLAVHTRRLFSGEPGRFMSLILILALVLTVGLGVGLAGCPVLSWIFDYIYNPIQATLGALLAFFAVSAAYRAFKLGSVAALIMLVVSLFLLFAQLPFSAAISPYLPAIRDWLLAIPTTAGVRGLILGVALGTVATSLRVLLAVDHPYASE
jgi:hypothetical protein